MKMLPLNLVAWAVLFASVIRSEGFSGESTEGADEGRLSLTTTTATTEVQESAWQKGLNSTHERLEYLYTSGQFSDLRVEFPQYNKSALVHRLVLAMSSPVFGSMLGRTMDSNSVWSLQDSPTTFFKLLEHMYLDKLELESVGEALQVYATAQKYQVQSANQLCSKYIVRHLTEETTLTALEASMSFGDEELSNACVQKLNRDPDAVIAPDAVVGLKKETLQGLLQKKLQVSSEVLVFKAVIAWGKAQLSQGGEEASGSALRKEVEDLLREVRFLTMTCEEFIDHVVGTDIFSPSEAILFLRIIRGANVTLLPESTPFSPSTKKRRRREDDLIEARIACVLKVLRTNLEGYNWRTFISDLKVSQDIVVHSLRLDYEGTVRITDSAGLVLGTSSSSGQEFIFPQPVLLEEGRSFNILFKPQHSLIPFRRIPQYFSITAGNVTLIYKNPICLDTAIFFWKHDSSH